MGKQTLSRLWGMRLLFVLLAGLVVFFHKLPLTMTPATWAPPDVILVLAFVWATRRPEYVPAILLAVVFLLSDMLFQRPPGLWAALALVLVEQGKSLERRPEENGLVAEFISFAVMLVLITIAYRTVLSLTAVPLPPLRLTLMQAGLTLLIYPLVVAISHAVLRVRRTGPGELDMVR